jgi:hypothetical protein
MGRACSMHGEERNAYSILVIKSEENRQVGRPRSMWGIILKWILDTNMLYGLD